MRYFLPLLVASSISLAPLAASVAQTSWTAAPAAPVTARAHMTRQSWTRGWIASPNQGLVSPRQHQAFAPAISNRLLGVGGSHFWAGAIPTPRITPLRVNFALGTRINATPSASSLNSGTVRGGTMHFSHVAASFVKVNANQNQGGGPPTHNPSTTKNITSQAVQENTVSVQKPATVGGGGLQQAQTHAQIMLEEEVGEGDVNTDTFVIRNSAINPSVQAPHDFHSFSMMPPEINSAQMFSGAGAGPMLSAAGAWNNLSSELSNASTSFQNALQQTSHAWTGTESSSMSSAAAPYSSWLSASAAEAGNAASQAKSTASAFESAFSSTVPPEVVAANRTQLGNLVSTNFFGVNTPAISSTEAQYEQMWAQDVGAMHGYHGGASVASSPSVLHDTVAAPHIETPHIVGAGGAGPLQSTTTVPSEAVAANRTQLGNLVSTNVFGVNTPAISSTEAQYQEMWAQDAAAMSGYHGGATHVASSPSVLHDTIAAPHVESAHIVGAGGAGPLQSVLPPEINSGQLHSGQTNTGFMNSGETNTGFMNSGQTNTGLMNSGQTNTGLMNSGQTNNGLMNSGAGSTPMLSAAGAWNGLSSELSNAATSFQTVTDQAAHTWTGPASSAMTSASSPYSSWLSASAAQAGNAASQANSAASAFESALTPTVQPELIAANRTQLANLVATNFFGLNTPAIASTEAQYEQMWAQDAAAMSGYHSGAMHVTSSPSALHDSIVVPHVESAHIVEAGAAGSMPAVASAFASGAVRSSASGAAPTSASGAAPTLKIAAPVQFVAQTQSLTQEQLQSLTLAQLQSVFPSLTVQQVQSLTTSQLQNLRAESLEKLDLSEQASFALSAFDSNQLNSLARSGVIYGSGTTADALELVKGNVLFTPTSDVRISTHNAFVSIPKGAAVWIMARAADLAVFDFHDSGATGPVKVTMKDKELTLSPGMQLVLTSATDFDSVNPAKEFIPHRNLRPAAHWAGVNAYVCDFSIPNGVANIAFLRDMLSSKDAMQRKLARSILKNAAILADLTGFDY